MQPLVHTLWGHPLGARRVPGGPAPPCPARHVLEECGPLSLASNLPGPASPEGALPRAGGSVHLAPLHKPLFLYCRPYPVVLGCGVSVPGTLYSGKFPNHQGSRCFICFNSGSLGTKNSRGRAWSRRSPAFREENDSAAHSEGSVRDGVRFCIRLRPERMRVCLPRDEWSLSWTCVGDAGWGLLSPGRGPPTFEPKHTRPGRALALRGTDGWMELGETSHTCRF